MDATNYLLKILDGIIGRILNTFEAQPKVLAEWAKSVLLWFCCTKQPPTMGALAGTLTKKVSSGNMSHGGIPNIDFIDRRCKRLVSVDTWTSVVQMSHPEIVISIKKCWTKDLAETQMKITTACLHYLLLDDFGFGHDNSDHLQETLRKHPFVEYAAKMRSGHVCESLKTPDDTAQHINSRCSNYSGPRKKWSSTKRAMRADLFQQNGNTLHLERVKSLETSLQLATAYGLTEVVEYLLRTTHGERG